MAPIQVRRPTGSSLPASGGISRAMKIPLRPYPLDRAAGDSLQAFVASGRSWEGALDPGQNGVAAAVVGKKTSEKGKAKLSVPDQSIYLCAFDRVPASRRSLITETYVVFKSLHKILNEPGDSWEDDEARLKALQGRPSTKFCRYYHTLGTSYVSQLSSHVSRLLGDLNALPPDAEDRDLKKELSLARDLRDCMALMVAIYLPADGEGKTVVGEELLAWINETDPKPTQRQLDQVSDLAVPYEDAYFWPRVYTCALRGRTDLAITLLRPLLKHPNPYLSSLIQSLTSLLSEAPRSFNFKEETGFLRAIHDFRGRVRTVEDALSDTCAEMGKVQRGAGAMDENTVDDLEASMLVLLEILRGASKIMLDLAEDWVEALGGWVRWVDPSVRRDDLPGVVERILKVKPLAEAGQTVPDNLLMPSLQASLLTGDAAQACAHAIRADTWLAAHMTDLFDKIGTLEPVSVEAATTGGKQVPPHPPKQMRLRDFCVLGYGEVLRSDPGLWRLAVEYWSTCGPEGVGRIRAALRRVIVDAEDVDEPEAEETEGNDGVAGMIGIKREKDELERTKARAGKRPTVREVREVCMEHDLEDEAIRLSKIKANQLLNHRRYGAAVSYCVDARDERLAARMTDRLMEEYILNGPEVFTQLVDEIPPSLLDPDAHLFRPDLFTTGAAETDIEPVAYSRFGSRLAFLARYRDMHSFYAKGDKEQAAAVLVHLLATELAPKTWWAILLVDAVPLLEDEQILISSRDTWELLRCLEAIVSPILASPNRRDLYGNLDYLKRIVSPSSGADGASGQKRDGQAETDAVLKQLDVVRHALARHLGRCLSGNV